MSACHAAGRGFESRRSRHFCFGSNRTSPFHGRKQGFESFRGQSIREDPIPFNYCRKLTPTVSICRLNFWWFLRHQRPCRAVSYYPLVSEKITCLQLTILLECSQALSVNQHKDATGRLAFGAFAKPPYVNREL
jgi:hypothetical protein